MLDESRIDEVNHLFDLFINHHYLDGDKFRNQIEDLAINQEIELDNRIQIFDILHKRVINLSRQSEQIHNITKLQKIEEVSLLIAKKLYELKSEKEPYNDFKLALLADLGFICLRHRNWRAAEKYLLDAISFIDEKSAENQPIKDIDLKTRIYGNLGNAYFLQGKYNEALKRNLHLINQSINQNNYQINTRTILFAHINAASAHYEMGNLEEQKEMLTKSLSIMDQHPELDRTNIRTTIHSLLSVYYVAMEDLILTLKHLNLAIENNKGEDVSIIHIYRKLVKIYYVLGKNDKAEECFSKIEELIDPEDRKESFEWNVAKIYSLLSNKTLANLATIEEILSQLSRNPPTEYRHKTLIKLLYLELQIYNLYSMNIEENKVETEEALAKHLQTMISEAEQNNSFAHLIKLHILQSRLYFHQKKINKAFGTLNDGFAQIGEKGYLELENKLKQEHDKLSEYIRKFQDEISEGLGKKQDEKEILDYLELIKLGLP
ncbi:MAG: tetratricopeptide repeat protein [Candidatus Hodarchaeales archaeon]